MDINILKGTAAREFYRHKLTEWRFELADTGRRLGCCKHNEQLIQISDYYARNNPAEKVLDTLMHEIAHALAGPGHGHDFVWKAIALRLGATPRACDSAEDTVSKPGEWQSKCGCCGRVHNRYKRPRILSGNVVCRCPGRGELTWKFVGDGPVPVVSNKIYVATCDGCGRVHKRLKRSRRGLLCKCRRGKVLIWKESNG